ncbi:NADH pyrophosphatase [Schizosaccharomyces japonicus yFS275]|uniref:NAD(+) diphosphatase n=1 Tax=Schizosaccharomyces japonicus (strain yFS275 / FY16936) TaxID=402676 RepID=B6K3A7_SCHJY|nr:NADH pyrophosphatase [Schizosaccharomyces japonicus yFS275]EEB07964.1 NADH pyrophosphatase [Schizosaccharomyces japonicus yFS275]
MSFSSSVTSLLSISTPPAHYLAQNPLNRLSFKREDKEFLRKAFTHPTTKFLPFYKLDPAVCKNTGELHYISLADVRPYLAEHPIEKPEKDYLEAALENKKLAPVTIYLGTSSLGDSEKEWEAGNIFAIDISSLDDLHKRLGESGVVFQNFRSLLVTGTISIESFGICSFARSLLDWNNRFMYCPGCGGPQVASLAGTKRICVQSALGRADCPSKHGVNNYQYPRTDPCVIMAVLTHDKQRILLGHGMRLPPGMLTCLAGFIEPGESIEEAVRRESYEEAGITVEKVMYHSSQPWPFPQSLMIGCFGIAKEGSVISRDKDLELDAADFFTREQVREVINWDASKGDALFKLPPPTSIAYRLIRAFAYDQWDISGSTIKI